MSISKNDFIMQKNGQILVNALREINQPTTFVNLTNFIAKNEKRKVDEIKESVKNTIEMGVQLGVFIKNRGKYSIYRGLSEDAAEEVQSDVDSVDTADDNEPTVVQGKRKRGTKRRTRSRSSKRSRSRKGSQSHRKR